MIDGTNHILTLSSPDAREGEITLIDDKSDSEESSNENTRERDNVSMVAEGVSTKDLIERARQAGNMKKAEKTKAAEKNKSAEKAKSAEKTKTAEKTKPTEKVHKKSKTSLNRSKYTNDETSEDEESDTETLNKKVKLTNSNVSKERSS